MLTTVVYNKSNTNNFYNIFEDFVTVKMKVVISVIKGATCFKNEISN